MRADRFTAVIDANVLVPALGRNILLSLAEEGFFRPRWTRTILNEVETAIAEILQARGANDAAAAANRARTAIECAFDEAMIEGHEPLIAGLDLPDEKDRHVLAAAIKARAPVIVTQNLGDFPETYLRNYETEARAPDTFLADTIDLYPTESVGALRRMRKRFKKPELTAGALLLKMEKAGLIDTAALLAEHEKYL